MSGDLTGSAYPGAPSWIGNARSTAEQVIEALIAGRRDLAETEIDVDALRAEANRILDKHAATLSSMSIGALFDLLGATDALAPADGKAFRLAYEASMAALDADGLASEAEATADEVEAVAAVHAARVELFRDMASAAQLVVRGVVGAVLAGMLSGL